MNPLRPLRELGAARVRRTNGVPRPVPTLPSDPVEAPPPTPDLDRTRAILDRQYRELGEGDGVHVTCPCSRRLHLRGAYRCRECGVWFCGVCALAHFGLTIDRETGRVVPEG